MNATAREQCPQHEPWHQPWPSNELERVLICPVCSSTDRTVLHEELVDNVFFVAPGRWTMHRCTRCASAYLDPRPSAASIHKAYDAYYTHASHRGRDDTEQLSWYRSLRRRLANGYVNARYGTSRQPASFLGWWVARPLPSLRHALDAEFRYLPKPAPGARLLDIGCGNGEFLLSAREAGWDVLGLEPDPKAAATARSRGLPIEVGSVNRLAGDSACFDAVALSHVLEHVHEPLALLEAAHRLLKPGGVIYIDTPNLGGLGAARFGKHWRGLEPPRHLVLFNLASLRGLLATSGFECIGVIRRTSVAKSMYLSSLQIVSGRSPHEGAPAKLHWRDRLSHLFTVQAKHLEFITLSARKQILEK